MKHFEVIEYDESYRDKWDNFVKGSNNGTIFHLQQFLDYHPPDRFKFHHLIFEQDSNIFALLPGSLDKGVFKSPAGASFGSFVTRDLSYDNINQLVQTFLKYAEENNIKEIYLTPPLIVYLKTMTQNLDYSLLHNGFNYLQHLYSSVIDLNQVYDLDHFEKRARNSIKKAIKSNIKVQLEDEYEEFYPILVENKKKFNLPPTHSLEELFKLKKLLPENLKLFIARMNNEMIGGSLIFTCNQKTIIDFYIAQNYDYQVYKPINLVLYEIIKWGHENKYEFFDIGVNQDTASDNPMDLNTTLISYKASFGARCYFRSTFYKKL